MSTHKLNLDTARRILLEAQGLGRPLTSDLGALLAASGFVRTLGGVDIYLAVRARRPGLTRDQLDQAVEAQEAQVVPAARGCMYLVARPQVGLCLRLANRLSASRDQRDQEKAGILPGEAEKLAELILTTLAAKGSFSTAALRSALPAGSVRSLGDQGKKVGISSPLPAALRRLEFTGAIERAHERRRLDNELYVWRLTRQNPLVANPAGDDPLEWIAELGRIFFRAAGLGRPKVFADWLGVAQKDAKSALERLELVPVTVEGESEPFFALPETALEAPVSERVAFLPFEDNLIQLQGCPRLLVDAAHHDLEVTVWGMSQRVTTVKLKDSKHPSLRTFVADNKIAGFWEFDPDQAQVVWASLAPLAAPTRERVVAEAQVLSRFLIEELGHAKSFTLDKEDDLRARSAFIRSLASQA